MREAKESEVRRLVREAVDRALGPPTAPAAPGAAPQVVGAAAAPQVVRAAAPRSAPSAAPRPAAPGRPSKAAANQRVSIGSDHGGFALKEVLKRAIADDLGWEVHDCGTHSTAAVDYPDLAAAVAREVASGRSSRGVIVDAAGIGSSIAANKVAGVRCALCHDDATVLNSREHNDANVLALGARVVNRGAASRMVRLFLTTPFGGGRHERRVQKIVALEQRAT